MSNERRAPCKVALFGDGGRADVLHAVRQVAPIARELADVTDICLDRSLDLSAADFDLLLNFGGDGSILGAARAMKHRQRPVAGVNFGKIGFLATFELPVLLTLLHELLCEMDRSPSIRRRDCIMLVARVSKADGSVGEYLALNDVVVSRGELSRIVVLDCEIDGELVTSYHVDGLVISTPVGSTAHSLAAGGPLLEPEMEALILAPICPHSLAVRPLVLGSNRSVTLRVAGSGATVGATFDGQSFVALEPGDSLTVTQYAHKFALLGPQHPGFYENLREKLLWGGHVEPFRARHHLPWQASLPH